MKLPEPFQESLDSLVKKLKSSRKADSNKLSKLLNVRKQSTIQHSVLPSPLMCLPAELRIQIWEEVLGGRAFHVQPDIYQTLAEERRDPKIWFSLCRSRISHEKTQEDFDERNGMLVALPFEKSRRSAYSKVPRQKEINCSLLRTCRRIYLEAKHLTWCNNTFVFTDWVPLGRFPQAIGPVSTALVTKIQLDIFANSALEEHYWDLKIRLMAREMTNLKELHIFIARPVLKPEPSRKAWEHQTFTTPFLPGILDLTRLRLRSMTLVRRTSENSFS
ncbi:hypothetical protein N7G274_000593 [Stereocaulon virgatum]|uniref:DUF7730 domain-containing protein n=1 Tax=Stereocaulon virgatum TaxID=373712 RepID=A0ABR4AV40_9LECA